MKVNHRTLFRLYTYQWHSFMNSLQCLVFLNQPITCVLHTELWPGMGLDVVGPLYATKTEFGTKFREMVATEGVPAAVRWRAAQFKE